ncbi:zinc finger BED domain-containing protein RICESLEEPER 3-like [Gossypium australe]|uniref:Zinc finger BED domain-containing protein RICESLEEPER 3-like n=1 Tax=Gossypium australe TaxID=47621 RepID=A0A5B6VNF5_9ROSI|nr:zinc finger BED domain-containing protein RICESLEEPER 3-like [Gossypium australe]
MEEGASFRQKGKVEPEVYRARLALPLELEKIHNVFHVSMLRRYRSDPSHIIAPYEVEIQPDLSYSKESIKILARKYHWLKSCGIITELKRLRGRQKN